MFPFDNEFTLLYFLYTSFYILTIRDLIIYNFYRKFKTFYLLIGFALNITFYVYPDNFQGGSSLAVLLFSFILLLIQLLIYFLFYILTKRKQRATTTAITQTPLVAKKHL